MEVASSSFENLHSEFSSDDDGDGEEEDDLRLSQDLEALRKACLITGSPPLSPPTPNPNQFDNFNFTTSSITDNSDSDEEEGSNDDELVRRIQQRISSLTSSSDDNEPVFIKPLQILDPVNEYTDDDDYQTLQAIRRRFASYNTIENVHDTLPSQTTQYFIDAIKKNRALQRVIRSKMIQIEGKIEENKKAKERMKLLREFQRLCQRRARRALSQNNNASVQLISACRSRKSLKVSDRKICPLFFGPFENSKVVNYRNVLQFNTPVRRPRWSDAERENLGKGIKQQLQEEVWLQNTLEIFSDPNVSCGDSNTFDDMIASITNYDFSPEVIRSFVPKVDWDRLASLYVPGRSGAECETRWLNHEDPLICRDPWTENEDLKIWAFAKEAGKNNWISFSSRMRPSRTPFQCFARYQRSLNSSVMKRDWTTEDDVQLGAAVKEFGLHDWQQVACNVSGRTGTQCLTRWMKTLDPARKRAGRWTVEEDKLLKVAVMIFRAKSWNKIAQFVPGRTQAQCRERWVNALDPYLKRAIWTEEEDSMLKEAFSKHGYCWSKVAQAVPHRSDSQCLKRWKVLFPHEVPKLQAARRIRKLALVANFVDREEERPALGPCHFIPSAIEDTPTESEMCAAENSTSKRKRKGVPQVEKRSSTEHQPEDSPTSRKKRKVKPHSLKKKATQPELGPYHFIPSAIEDTPTESEICAAENSTSKRKRNGVPQVEKRSSTEHQPEDNPTSGKIKSHSLKKKATQPELCDNQESVVKNKNSQGTASSGWNLFHSKEITETPDEEDVPLVNWLRAYNS